MILVYRFISRYSRNPFHAYLKARIFFWIRTTILTYLIKYHFNLIYSIKYHFYARPAFYTLEDESFDFTEKLFHHQSFFTERGRISRS
jgi:hypothetical protein